MKKETHPVMREVHFSCASCNNNFKILSTLKSEEVAIDICSQCHPFYIGATSQQSIKGRAEKLSSKFNAGKETITSKKNTKVDNTPKEKDNKSNKIKTLSDL